MNIIFKNEKSEYMYLTEYELIGKTIHEIDTIFTNFQKEKIDKDERVFVLKSKFFGIFKTRIYLYFVKGILLDYYIGI
jgi:hypothetical protein